MKLSDYVVRFLADGGVDSVFGYSGGAITHLMDSLRKCKGIRFIQTYHEQSAAIAAEGYAWYSRNIGVAMATSGPGATNLITGIADAYFDSIPTLFITGQVNTYEYKKDKLIRQQGFQETDIVAIVRPITKYATLVTDANSIRRELEKAFLLARTGRPGPVLLDIPMDVQRAVIEADNLPAFVQDSPDSKEMRFLDGFSKEKLRDRLNACKRPILLFGGGGVFSMTGANTDTLLRKARVPVVTSLLGKGIARESDDLFLGMIGSYGNRCANLALANSDLVIAVGTRLDTRQTGTNLASFVRSGRIIRVDIDENEIRCHRLKNTDGIVCDAGTFIQELIRLDPALERKDWIEHVLALKNKYNQDEEIARNVKNKTPYLVMDILNRFASESNVFTVDIGQNQMFAAQKIRVNNDQRFKTSGGLAPMGFALPAAVGAAFASGRKTPIFAIAGDGGLHIALQSLMLLSQYDLPIKVILLNNKTLGMITQFQDQYFDQRKEGTTKESGYFVPDFGKIAAAYSLKYRHFDRNTVLETERIQELLAEPGPALLEFSVGEDTVVYPKLEVSLPIEEISPRLGDEELEKAMLIGRMEITKAN